MKALNIISNAQAHRRMIPSTFTCGCCKLLLGAGEHMADDLPHEHTISVQEEYGFNVCFVCADNFKPHENCDICNREVCTCDDAYDEWRSEQ